MWETEGEAEGEGEGEVEGRRGRRKSRKGRGREGDGQRKHVHPKKTPKQTKVQAAPLKTTELTSTTCSQSFAFTKMFADEFLSKSCTT